MQIDATTYRSPNHNARPSGVDAPFAVVVHTTAGRWPTDAQWLCTPQSRVSAHYIIAPDGAICQLVDDRSRAWHAGRCAWAGITDWNGVSLGIELSAPPRATTLPDVQIDALTALTRLLRERYCIPKHLIVTHRRIAVPRGRKIDPEGLSDAAFERWKEAL